VVVVVVVRERDVEAFQIDDDNDEVQRLTVVVGVDRRLVTGGDDDGVGL